jgi:hypothetical protein
MKIFIFYLLFLWTFQSISQSSYSIAVISARKVKEAELLDAKKGILTAEDLSYFKGLNYFFIDTNYVVQAQFRKSVGKKFEMPTSTERKPIYRKYGCLSFNINGKPFQLTVYQNMELKGNKGYKNYFFVPFRDLTCGDMSYGGGRYLDLILEKTQTEITLDFNLAYNPYCAYSHRYSCPIPPEENTLNIFLYSGEKKPILK